MLGPLMIDIAGKTLSAEDKILLSNPLVSAIILFSRNYESQEQLKKLISEIRQEKPDILISVDHEGGRVQRFREGFLRIPPMRSLGHYYDQDPVEALLTTHAMGWALAAELLAFDIDFSFTPVLDVDHGVSEIIGDRAFHTNPHTISLLTRAFMNGLHEAGMQGVGKHFPGHGAVAPDSHLEIPVDDRPFEVIEKEDLEPFKELIAAGIGGIMPAHIVYSQLDKHPAGFSKFWLQQVLREQLKFDGIIFSDDLSMEGASAMGNYQQRAEAALKAGCDMILVCNNRPAALELVQSLQWTSSPDSERRIQGMKAHQTFSLEAVRQHPHWMRAQAFAQKETS